MDSQIRLRSTSMVMWLLEAYYPKRKLQRITRSMRGTSCMSTRKYSQELKGRHAVIGRRDHYRMDLGGMLTWDPPDCDVFRSILAHPRPVPHLRALLGDGYRMDHLPLLITQTKAQKVLAYTVGH